MQNLRSNTSFKRNSSNSDLLSTIEYVTVGIYKDTDVKSINYHITDTFAFTLFENEDGLTENGLFLKISEHSIEYFDENMNLVLTAEIANDGIIEGLVMNTKTGSKKIHHSQLNGFFSDWYDCIDDTVNLMADEPLLAIGCVATGSACAQGIVVGCAISGAFGRFRSAEPERIEIAKEKS